MYRQAVWDEPLLSDLSKKGSVGFSLPKIEQAIERKSGEISRLLPAKLIRSSLAALPELSEPEIVRHFVRLSQMNFGIDLGMYPLGSCTMKYNPKISQRIARDPKVANLHPYQTVESVQGILEILYELERLFCEITGVDSFSLQPAAGAQGEYVGALIVGKYLADSGARQDKKEMLVPDSAHGTNPASAAMAGFKVVKIPSSEKGLVSSQAVKKLVGEKTAGMMLTVPNTLGLFESEIEEVSEMVHDSGGLMYYDGANMNALLGRVRPGDMGFDIVHINVHKTFATPHGGGGPGAGPVGVKSTLSKYLPVPRVALENSSEVICENSPKYKLNYEFPDSIGPIKSFFGNIGVLLRAYCYIHSYGSEGLRNVSEQAVLASNYLLSLLDQNSYSSTASKTNPAKHEFVVSTSPLTERTGISAGDVGKAILDYGMHSPTIYFPLIINEALMIEPTETESLENLQTYAKILNTIAKNSVSNKKMIQDSPQKTASRRLDERRASHPGSMVLRWQQLRK